MTTVSPWPMPTAALDWPDGLPCSAEFGDIYFSRGNGLAESRHVFIDGNRLPARWQALAAGEGTAFTVAETGFGTGLNFLACWQAWQQHAPAGAWLHYISVEKYPLTAADLARALALWPALAAEAGQLQAAWPPPLRGHHYRVFPGARIRLHLIFDEAESALAELHDSLQASGQGRVNAWLLDGFAPRQNPALWQPSLLARLRALSADDATLATFTAVGEVRRALAAAGFAVSRQPGFGRKRHMTCGQAVPVAQTAPPPPTRYLKPGPDWHLPLRSQPAGERRALVIGAGLAGLFTAWSLARRGWQVAVLEAGARPAAGASGNRLGILFHRLSPQDGPLARFSQQALLYSGHWYRQAVADGLLPADCLRSEGMLQLPVTDAQADSLPALAQTLACPALAQWLDAEAATRLAGAPLPGPALHWPASATLAPAAICTALAAQPGLTLHTQAAVAELTFNDGQWQARAADGRSLAAAPVAVIANGPASRQLAQTAWLPLQALRGQVSHVPASAASAALRVAVCHDGYITPAADGRHGVGASFDLHDDSAQLSAASHRDNLQRLARHWPAMHRCLEPADSAVLEGRVGFRHVSPDYLPAVGPVPEAAAFRQRFAALAGNARRPLPGPAPMLPGLYLNTGHGSRGLSYAPLAGELLACLIADHDRPLDPELRRALAPARFLARALARHEEAPA